MVGAGGSLSWTDVKGDNVQRLRVQAQGVFQTLTQTHPKKARKVPRPVSWFSQGPVQAFY